MKKKIEFNELPDDLIVYINYQLKDNYQDQNTLLSLSKQYYNLFQTDRLDKLITKLLLHVAKGEQEKVEIILTSSPELLLLKGQVKDCSGRKFKNISAFQLALWALDVKYMIPMMLNCVPKNEEGDKIKYQLLHQYEDVKTKGVSYKLNGTLYTEQYYDFSPLINALQDYINNFDIWTLNECKTHWCHVVGKAQRMVPAHIAQHYCDVEEFFSPKLQFNDKTFKRVFSFYNRTNNKNDTWFLPTGIVSGLGISFAIFRGNKTWKATGMDDVNLDYFDVSSDLATLITLRTMRTIELELLKEYLQNQLKESEIKPKCYRCVML